MKYSSIPSAQTLVFYCKSKGIKNIVISPGSRNAPLTIGFSEDPFFDCYSVVDERCAAFFSLGMAQNLQVPVIAVCTSGSALLNYYPAVAEAFYSDIPLVVISADRPVYKIDIGDGQTIWQKNVFDKHIGYSANLKQDIIHALNTIKAFGPKLLPKDASYEKEQKAIQEYNEAELGSAFDICIEKRTPIHINIPFEEPLYEVLDVPSVSLSPPGKETIAPIEEYPWIELKEIWNSSKRILLIIGVNSPFVIDSRFLEEVAEMPNVLVFTEVTSNVHHPNFFPSIDSIIAPIEKNKEKLKMFGDLQPDLLISLGGLIVSKKVKAFLRNYKPKEHWHVDPIKAYDTFFSLSRHLKLDVNLFFDKILEGNTPSPSDYYQTWNMVKKRYIEKREVYLSGLAFSDFKAFSLLCESIPKRYMLQLANSSTVRYAQLFDIDPSVRVYCNRGTSGIDGSVSTAIGAAVVYNHPTLLITGDLSFLYDSNGLWNDHIKPDFRIVVINNGGGGIFRILPGKKESENFEKYFETTHHLDIEKFCSIFRFEHRLAADEDSLKKQLNSFYLPSSKPVLLEVKTPRIINDKILLAYFDFIS